MNPFSYHDCHFTLAGTGEGDMLSCFLYQHISV